MFFIAFFPQLTVLPKYNPPDMLYKFIPPAFKYTYYLPENNIKFHVIHT